MKGKVWVVGLLTMIVIVVTLVTVVMAYPPCIDGCEDRSNCGDCEVVEPEICGQQGCKLLTDYIVVSYEGQCQTAAGPKLQQWRRKTWWDCNGDGQADCECWTWYVRWKPQQ